MPTSAQHCAKKSKRGRRGLFGKVEWVQKNYVMCFLLQKNCLREHVTPVKDPVKDHDTLEKENALGIKNPPYSGRTDFGVLQPELEGHWRVTLPFFHSG